MSGAHKLVVAVYSYAPSPIRRKIKGILCLLTKPSIEPLGVGKELIARRKSAEEKNSAARGVTPRPVELHYYEQGGHGFGMYLKETTSTGWFDAFVKWLGMHGYLKPKT